MSERVLLKSARSLSEEDILIAADYFVSLYDIIVLKGG